MTGTANTILEKFESVSKGKGAVTDSGDNNYYVDVHCIWDLEWIYWMDFPAGQSNWGTEATGVITYSDPTADLESATLSGGAPASSIAPTDGQRSDAFDRFEDPDTCRF